MQEFIDKTSTQEGTKINRKAMMAVQGFQGINTVFNSDGSITETNSDGHTLTTTFNADGTITETFTGKKTITKNTYSIHHYCATWTSDVTKRTTRIKRIIGVKMYDKLYGKFLHKFKWLEW